ncbi:MAG TPA: M24 family metallopeptidase [Patescibacteria group bacterium]|nr:M24 family metallopeptidase [Patescibacteria group bacterium]
MWSKNEVAEKLHRIRKLMVMRGLEYLVLSTQTDLMWLTGGRGYVNQAAEKACADIVVGHDAAYLVTNNIEADRLLTEEMPGLNFKPLVYYWWDGAGRERCLAELTGKARTASERDLGLEFSCLRWTLTPEEQERYREVGRRVGSILGEVAMSVIPGDSEEKIASRIRQRCEEQELSPWVTLVAADERVYHYRHPLPTGRRLEKHALLVLTAQQYGLYAAASRLVHFGPVPADLRRRHRAVVAVDTALMAATVPEARVADIFHAGMEAYKEQGFPDEWQRHHQGGLIGYLGREYRGTPDSPFTVGESQAFAWNPSIAGTKSEDTLLIAAGGAVLLTESPGFPCLTMEKDGKIWKRPDILQR